MAVEFRVIAIEDCQPCNGVGIVLHPLWARYWKSHPQGLPTHDDDLAWFRDNGHISSYTKIPPEEIPCADCEGTGAIRREVPLLEALQQLDIHPRPRPNVRGPFITHIPERSAP